MSLKTQLQSGGAFAPSLTLEAGESARILVNVDKEAREHTRHALQRGGACTGPACKLCAADVPKKTKTIVDAYREIAGAWLPVALWLSQVDRANLGKILPESGKCVVVIVANTVLGDNGKPKTGASGRPWTDWSYTLERADSVPVHIVTADGEVVETQTH